MRRHSLFALLSRRFSLEEDVRQIACFHSQLRAAFESKTPTTDYQRCLKKVNFALFRRMVDEYEANVKPLAEDDARAALTERLRTAHGLRVQSGTTNQFLSFVKDNHPFQFELRVFRFIERLAASTPQLDELRTAEAIIEEQRRQKKERESGDERLFFKVDGRFVHTEALAMERHLYAMQHQEETVMKNPFFFHDADTNSLEVQVILRRSDRSGLEPALVMDGFVTDL